MTPDQPITLAVAIVGCFLSLILPKRYAIVPLLALAIILYPSTVLMPPKNLSLTAQRAIAAVLFLRCIFQSSIRQQFKWRWVDTAALLYFILITASMVLALPQPGPALNNRAGFLLSAMLPFWCVRFLVVDRPSLYALLKGWVWAAVPLALMGVYQMYTGDSPYFRILMWGNLWIRPPNNRWDMRPLFGNLYFRASGPILGFIMFGWYFALLVAPATNLFFQKRKFLLWGIAFLALPVGVLSSIASGPMMMMVFSAALVACFPLRKHAKLAFAFAGSAWLALMLFANRGPMEFVANMGKDQASSWYRVKLQNFTLYGLAGSKPGMDGHWLTGYGEIPPAYNEAFHDLCIHWVWLLVIHGIMGFVGFYGFMGASAWNLWKAHKMSDRLEDQWLLWSLMAMLVASILGMLVVALFSEVYFIYHMMLGVIANAPLLVNSLPSAGKGTAQRIVGILVEENGHRKLYRARLNPGQTIAIVHPGERAPTLKEEEPAVAQAGPNLLIHEKP
jgi:hypothetical protein